MTFLTHVENELNGILSGEWSEPAALVAGSFNIPCTVIFDRTSLEIDENGMNVLSNNPQAGIFIKNIDTILGHELIETDNATLTVRATVYRVKVVERDGTGYATLRLKK